MQRLSSARRANNDNANGRMAQDEVDMLRSAIVFTSSGLDASMKRLVNDVGRCLILRPNTGARAQYEKYLKDALSAPSVDEHLRLAVISHDANDRLLNYYLSARTKASFQGSGDLESRVREVLGISKSKMPSASLKALDGFFMVRNSIVHSMDYKDVSKSTSTARTHRSSEDMAKLCDQTFDVAADLMHAAADVLQATR